VKWCRKLTTITFVWSISSTVVVAVTLPDLHYTLAVVTLVLVRLTRQPTHYSTVHTRRRSICLHATKFHCSTCYAVIDYNCDSTTIRLRRIARACFYSTRVEASKKWTSIFRRSRIVVVSQSNRAHISALEVSHFMRYTNVRLTYLLTYLLTIS